MHDGQIVFAGCARDCARHLPAVFESLDRLGPAFGECAYVFAENDSRDGTRQALAAYGQDKPRFASLTLHGLSVSAPQRTVRLAVARNAVIACLRQWDEVREFDYLLLLDLDDIGIHALHPDALARALGWMAQRADVAAIFPNQLGPYYDLWALRHPTLCPGDVWEEVLDHKLAQACDDSTAYAATFARRLFTLAPDAPPLEVDSAFGGLGVYRLADVLRNPHPYVGDRVKILRDGRSVCALRWQQCEHVHFHAGLRRAGRRLFVLPDLINAETQDIGFAPSAFRTMSF